MKGRDPREGGRPWSGRAGEESGKREGGEERSSADRPRDGQIRPADDPLGAGEEILPAPGTAALEGPGARAEDTGEAEVDYKDRWLRSEADFQNFRRRSQRDLEEAVRANEERLLLEMISQLDDLERALEAATEAGAPEPWVQGVRLIANRMSEFLARQGVAPLDPLGEPFDPELHEALLEVDATESIEPGDVVQVVRKGYRRGGRALRPARVVVARRAATGA